MQIFSHPARTLVLPLAVALAAAGCGQDEPAPPSYPTEPYGHVFDSDRILEVEIEVAEPDWDTLRYQTRTWWDAVMAPGAACLDQPFPSPFTYFPASVTVDGVRRDNVGVRKKGFLGSLDENRPAFKVRFDRYVPDQTLHGLHRLTLNNSVQDPSYVKQCLAYDLFARAGVPVPRCNFAHVRLNGRDLGLYVNVESMDRDFLRRNFEDESGNLWEGEFSDFRIGWTGSWELKTNEPEGGDQTQVDRGRFAEIARAIDAREPDGLLVEHVEQFTDLEDFLTYWAMEVLLVHWDGYANNVNNTFVYDDPQTGKLVFMPWGTDQIFVQDPFVDVPPPPSVYATGWLTRRLYLHRDVRNRYYARLRTLLDTVWNEAHLLDEVARMENLFTPVLEASGADLEGVREALADVRDFIRARRGALLADMAQGPPAWDRPPKGSICVDRVGDASGRLSTTFGTIGEPNLFASGSGAIGGTYRGRVLQVGVVGGAAGWNPNDPDDTWPYLTLSGQGVDGNWYSVWLNVRPDKFRPGEVAAFEDGEVSGGHGFWNPRQGVWTFMGSFVQGRLHVEAAGTEDGARVRVRYEADVVQWQ